MSARSVLSRSALEQTWERVGFEDPAAVERLLVRGAIGGALAAALALLVGGLGRTASTSGYTLALTASILLVLLPKQGLGVRLSVLAASCLLPVFVPTTPSTFPFLFTVPLGLMLANEPLSHARRLVLAVGPTLGAAWCLLLERWLSARHLGPGVALGWLALGGAGLFVSVGAALAWLSFAADAVEPKLASQPKVLHAWQRVRTALGRLPTGAPRTELEALAREGVARWLAVKAERDQLAESLDEQAEQEAREAVTALSERISETTDAELSAHLGQLRRVHKDTLEQLDGLRRRVERLEARTAAEAGWLETAAFSLELAPRGEAGTRELASRLRSLSPSPCVSGETVGVRGS